MQSSLEAANRLGAAKKLFPKLETVAISSIYGRETDAWKRYEDANHGNHALRNPHRSCSFMFEFFLSGSNIRHLCVRDPTGPLTVLHMTMASDPSMKPVDYTRTVHLPPEIDTIPIPLGNRLTLTCDAPSTADLAEILSQMLFYFQKRVIHRGHVMLEHPYPDTLDLDIFCSTKGFTPHTFASKSSQIETGIVDFGSVLTGWDERDTVRRVMTVAEEQRALRAMRDKTAELFQRNSKLKDKVEWSTSDLTPVCKACGSGPPA